ncbi:type III PLP-dependent enzyme [Neiella sp. HB171785]|uniref:Type III PLP-dependent enzyme n=1 Tax=Neiella litorisoli TaxID=2771431 RepID=A0A8J6UF58_9GAMM|nr:type III PLP-dependent enzyme [Neiella litorisoli]MBD1390584.1 type III PLP-dependent enzyme [Neiella litorisoli]
MTLQTKTELVSGHCFQQPICFSGQQLMWAGESAQDWMARSEGSACYVYDMAVARRQVEQLRSQLPDSFDIFYAVKANPNPEVLSALEAVVDGVDVASIGELERAMAAGFSADQVSFAGPAKLVDEIERTLALGGHLSVESLIEMQRVISWANHNQQQVAVGVRLNPQFQLKASGMHMGGGAQPFGIDEEQFADLVALVKASPLVSISGLHIYAGSQCLQLDALVEQFRQSLLCFKRLSEEHQLTVTKLNFGGGIGVPYFPNNKPVDLVEYGQAIRSIVNEHQAFVVDKSIILELGRYIMAEAGVYLCQVTDVKSSRGQLFAMVNGGMHHHLANSGNLGQLLKKNYPIVVANKMASEAAERVTICGPLCTPLDVLARQLEVPKLDLGDIIAIFQSGAYGLTASPNQFLSHNSALEWVV